GQRLPVLVQRQLATDSLLAAYQYDPDPETSGGENRTLDFRFRGVISAHCVHGDGHHRASRSALFDFNHFATLVLPAVGANAVGQFRLMAVRTFGDASRFQAVVCATILRAPVGVTSFR